MKKILYQVRILSTFYQEGLSGTGYAARQIKGELIPVHDGGRYHDKLNLHDTIIVSVFHHDKQYYGLSSHRAKTDPSLLPSSRCRRSSGGAGEALHPEAASVLRPVRLCLGPAERPEMEGGEAGGAQRDGGVHHPQQECYHRAHLPRGGAHGQ